MTKKHQAATMAKHYFRLIAERAGVQWGYDNDAEIEGLVSLIIAAAAEAVAEQSVKSPENRVKE